MSTNETAFYARPTLWQRIRWWRRWPWWPKAVAERSWDAEWVTIVRQGGVPIGWHADATRPNGVYIEPDRWACLYGLVTGRLHFSAEIGPGERWHPGPRVVCLCGSTRFGEAFEQAACDETLAGRIVLTVNDFDTARRQPVGHHPPTEEKARLDELHLRKIDLADEVLILNVGGYIGEGTARELAYAREHGKVVRFLESEG